MLFFLDDIRFIKLVETTTAAPLLMMIEVMITLSQLSEEEVSSCLESAVDDLSRIFSWADLIYNTTLLRTVNHAQRVVVML